MAPASSRRTSLAAFHARVHDAMVLPRLSLFSASVYRPVGYLFFGQPTPLPWLEVHKARNVNVGFLTTLIHVTVKYRLSCKIQPWPCQTTYFPSLITTPSKSEKPIYLWINDHPITLQIQHRKQIINISTNVYYHIEFTSYFGTKTNCLPVKQ